MTTPSLVTVHDPFIAPPRITRGTFDRVLREAGSPWADRAGEIYDLIAGAKQDPAVWLAICAEEHSFGANRDSVLWRNDTRSWTNARTVRDPSLSGWTIIHDSVRGSGYVRYRDVVDSVRDGLYRVTDPHYRYVREDRRTIAEVFAIWTEGDGGRYAASVVRRINAWMARERAEGYVAVIPGLVDVRDQLARRDPDDGVPAGPFERRALGEKHGVVVHYSGPPVTGRGDTLAVLRRAAHYHVGKNWARAGEPAVYGDGLMYHVAVGDDGTAYLCRDLEAVLWHCGVWPQNALALAVHLPIGGDQRATPAQLGTLRSVVDAWREATGTPVTEVWGHHELSPTTCPGTLMDDFVRPYRASSLSSVRALEVTDGSARHFVETGCRIQWGFKGFYESFGDRALQLFGYPLTDELQEDGRTVQYFERAVFEWHPGNHDPYKVLLRRVGAESLDRRNVISSANSGWGLSGSERKVT